MVDFENSSIRNYENLIREILNNSVNKIDWVKLEESDLMFVDKMQKLFKFNNRKGWSLLTACLDSLGDSHLAIFEYLNYPIKNIQVNYGEDYLRLYGVLNGVYIHWNSILSMAELLSIKTSKMNEGFSRLNASFMRNSIASHPTNFLIEKKSKTNFKIARFSINQPNEITIIDANNNFKKYNLIDSIIEYLNFAEIELERIVYKLIQNRYQKSDSNRKKFENRLAILTKS